KRLVRCATCKPGWRCVTQRSGGGAGPASRSRAIGCREECLAEQCRYSTRYSIPYQGTLASPHYRQEAFPPYFLIDALDLKCVDYPAREGLLRTDYMNGRIRRNDPVAYLD